MPTRPQKKMTASILIPFLVLMLFFTIMIRQKYRSSHEAPVAPQSREADGSRLVTLFFAAEGARLARETREVEPCGTVDVCLKNVLDELLNGPVGEFDETIPDGTVVEEVRLEKKQVTIEFNRGFSDAMPSGSSAEMLSVYSVVNTVAINFPHIETVKINVDGNSDVILPHLDLSKPLVPDYSLEQSRPSAAEKKSRPASGSHR